MQLMEMEERLIGFDTTSVNSNLEMVDFLESYLKGLGMQVLTDASPDGRKANLLATLGAPDTGGLMLAGHMDVVPVAGQAWDGDPFAVFESGKTPLTRLVPLGSPTRGTHMSSETQSSLILRTTSWR